MDPGDPADQVREIRPPGLRSVVTLVLARYRPAALRQAWRRRRSQCRRQPDRAGSPAQSL